MGKVRDENYLERIPKRKNCYSWRADENGIVTIEIENRGFFNRVAQKFFRRPKISYVHLDEMGSFIWQMLDGEKTILDIGKSVEESFGDKAKPLYERLARYVQILESYNFIEFK